MWSYELENEVASSYYYYTSDAYIQLLSGEQCFWLSEQGDNENVTAMADMRRHTGRDLTTATRSPMPSCFIDQSRLISSLR